MTPTSTAIRCRYRGGFMLASLAPTVLALVLSGAASAQNSGAPPALVGRIAGIHGQVSMHRSDQEDWSQASPNEPITVGDAVYADVGGEARLEVGGARLVLKSDSELDIANLDRDSGRMRLDTGMLDIRVGALPTQDGLYILTPRGTVRLTRRGSYRIEAGTEDQPTRITSWDGAAEVGDSGAAVAVQPGQTLLISGSPDAPQYSYDRDIGPTPEDVRPPPPRIAASIRSYVPPDMTGAEDLGEYGSWDQAPDYGPVWYPSDVPADWAPYHYGHWEFVPPWGWTWIDDQPWGFAPFHYGRWAFIAGRWGWCPGQYEPHPIYAPALVAFIGGGALAASISIGFGGGEPVGWVPLAPGEFYRPPYQVNNTYIQNINRTVIVNNTTINRTVIEQGPGSVANLANRRFATVVPADAMASARPVAKAAVAVQPAAIEHAQVSPQVVAAIQHPARPVGPQGRPGPAFQPGAPRTTFAAPPTLPPTGRQPGAPIPQRPVPAGLRPNLPPQPGMGSAQGAQPQPAGPHAPGAPPPRPGTTEGAALPQGFRGSPSTAAPPPARPGGAPSQNQAAPPGHAQGFRGLPPAPPPPRGGAPSANQIGAPEHQPGFRAPPSTAAAPPPRPTAPTLNQGGPAERRQGFQAPQPTAAPVPPRPAPMERQQFQHPSAPPPPRTEAAPPHPTFTPPPRPPSPPMERPAPAFHQAPPPRPAPAPSPSFAPPPRPAAPPAPAPAARPMPAPAPQPAPPQGNQKKDEHH